jgi:hypothetical protein
MIKLVPSVFVGPLSQVKRGSLVMFGDRCAITTTSLVNPDVQALIIYDPATLKFVFLAQELPSEVVAFDGDLELRPDLDTLFIDGRADRNSANELFLDGVRPLIPVSVGVNFRLLDLSTGLMDDTTVRTPLTTGFRNWKICARVTTDREPFPLLEIARKTTSSVKPLNM